MMPAFSLPCLNICWFLLQYPFVGSAYLTYSPEVFNVLIPFLPGRGFFPHTAEPHVVPGSVVVSLSAQWI